MPNRWNTDNIPDLSGKVVIVTGANAGLGFESSKEMARKGAHVIMACRNMDKAQVALSQLRGEVPSASVDIMQLDLASLKSVHHFAEQFKDQYHRLDILINNAGIMFVPYGITEDGFEQTFGVDHLGHFALTGLLLDVLNLTPNSRVVNVSSFAHAAGKMDFDDLLFENEYDRGDAYSRSKLANIMFTYELQRRFESMGADSIAVAVNPGFVRTNWTRHITNPLMTVILRVSLRIIGQSTRMGALSLLRAAIDHEAKGGEYYSTARRFRGYPVPKASSESSYDQEDARKLWEVSEELTGVKYSFDILANNDSGDRVPAN